MGNPLLLSFSLCFLVLFNVCLATDQNIQGYRSRRYGESQRYGEGQRRYRECRLDRLDALEPSNRIEAEGGVIEMWDPNHEEFQCAGVAFQRYLIDPKGLLLPQYTNAPRLMYVERGRGFKGVVLSGCPETYQESQQSAGEFRDRHQKIRRVRTGDLFAVPAGSAHWTYNDGNEKLIVVVLLDVSNHANQLDFHPRAFYLAGNPEEEFPERRSDWKQEQTRHSTRREGSSNKNNIFFAFDDGVLAEVLNINTEMARKLRGEDDFRRNIIKVEGQFEVIKPPRSRGGQRGDEQQWEEEQEEEQERADERSRGRRGHRWADENGLDETICSMRLKENIGDASRADIYTPEAGRLSTTNSHRFPILRWLKLSAERGVLYRNAMYVPHWNQNAHSVIFVTRGRARVQVVDDRGQTVFDGELQQRQLLVVPQNFAIVKKASDEGFEWVSFKTNDNAMISPLAGRTSAMRAFPVQVIASAYRISNEEALRLKFNREETTLLPPRMSSSARRANPIEAM
ncbi:11S globulin subunit beta-like [Cucurbita maxima]|uniref:11S globulin subunit beta-like n=1 Tax=Cucurbita maxima TaxID=3661 RepID=A0A6J1HXD8_CUCMA|nr:11S globulin subunit beta-like [Cucurbita maxima]